MGFKFAVNFFADMGKDFDGLAAFVSEKLLNVPEVGSGFQQIVDITASNLV